MDIDSIHTLTHCVLEKKEGSIHALLPDGREVMFTDTFSDPKEADEAGDLIIVAPRMLGYAAFGDRYIVIREGAPPMWCSREEIRNQVLFMRAIAEEYIRLSRECRNDQAHLALYYSDLAFKFTAMADVEFEF
jgi:hypothetical protein